jgi:hypothetical protein
MLVEAHVLDRVAEHALDRCDAAGFGASVDRRRTTCSSHRSRWRAPWNPPNRALEGMETIPPRSKSGAGAMARIRSRCKSMTRGDGDHWPEWQGDYTRLSRAWAADLHGARARRASAPARRAARRIRSSIRRRRQRLDCRDGILGKTLAREPGFRVDVLDVAAFDGPTAVLRARAAASRLGEDCLGLTDLWAITLPRRRRAT